MSAKAQKAVDDARELADELHADGQFRAAEIIRRVCRSNDSYRVTLGQLWKDNMALRGEGGEQPLPVEGEEPIAPPRHIADIPAADVFAALDQLSRKRALTESESEALEAAMRGQTIITKRDAARLGIKRDMASYGERA